MKVLAKPSFIKNFDSAFKVNLKRTPQTMTCSERIKDSVINLINGYKPHLIKGIDPNTGKKIIAKDKNGNIAINWVKKTYNSSKRTTDSLRWNGSRIIAEFDMRKSKRLEQTNFNQNGYMFTKYKDGEVEFYTKNMENPYFSYYAKWKRNIDGKFEKVTTTKFIDNEF